jgi:adenine-specific DNA-methyltransferase
MKLNIKKPREFINPMLSKKSVAPAKFAEFKVNYSQYCSAINVQHAGKQSEPNIVSNALKPFIESLGFTSSIYSQKGQSGVDLVVLHNNVPAVLFEAKKHGSMDMISGTNVNTKAFHESVLYFMRERDKGNQELCHIVITDFYSWFTFDAKDFDRLFWKNTKIRNLYKTHTNPSLLGDTTKEFYFELQKAIEKLKIDLFDEECVECCYFETKSVKNDKDLLAIFKLLSADCLTKSFNPNDANSLNREFYNELLYLLGLEEDSIQRTIHRSKQQQIGSLFENITNKLSQHDKRNDFDTVINLIIIWINRILFLKLLESQIVKWTSNATNKFLNKEKITQYSALEELFFDVLAKPINKRKSQAFNYIPYLNSSLFEINPEEKAGITIGLLSADAQVSYYKKTVIKDEHGKRKSGQVNTLEYLFEFLDAYDFGNDSAEEIGDDTKTLISASVLGLIFEKINGYKDGSFYTPSFVTMFMARQLLRKVVLERFRAVFEDDLKGATWAELKRYCDKHSHKDDFIKRALPVIDTMTVCDPAVGSGHYLVSALNEIVFIKYELGLFAQKDMRLDLLNDELHISLGDEWFEYKRPTSFICANHLLQKSLFEEKQRIIENQLFGVDINPNSTQITKLRLWIELLKHSYYDNQYQLVTLPNIDINIKTGNSVVHRFGLTDDIKEKNIKAEISKYKAKVKEYKERVGSKHDVLTVIGQIKEKFNQTLKNRHLKTKALAVKLVEYVNIFGLQGLGKDLQSLAIDATQGQIDLFGVDHVIAKLNKGKQVEMLGKVKTLHDRVKFLESGQIYHDAFEWRFEFPEALDEKGEFVGFDAVIANPPYIDSEKMLNDGHENLREYLNENYSCAVGNWDLYIVFMELASNIMKNTGTMSYITPDKWLSKSFGDEFRRRHIGGIEHVIMLGRDVFESALVDSIITQVSNTPIPTVTASSMTNGSVAVLNKVLKTSLAAPYSLDPLLSPNYEFIDRLDKAHGRLIDMIACESACATADAYKLKPFVMDCHGAFNPGKYYSMTNTGTLGKYVSRWGVKPMTYLKDKYLRPIVSRSVFKKNFTNSYKTKSDAKKIIVKGLTLLDAALDLRGEMIPGKTTLVLISTDDDVLKYACAILNCPLSIFYIKAKYGSASYNGGINFTKEMLNSIPFPADAAKKKKIVKLVDRILVRKEADHDSDISDLERDINRCLYALYGLSLEEIDMVEGVVHESALPIVID